LEGAKNQYAGRKPEVHFPGRKGKEVEFPKAERRLTKGGWNLNLTYSANL